MPSPTRKRKPFAVLLLALLIPLAMGGCPNVREEFVTAFETALRGIADAALDDAFNNLRGDNL